MQTCKPLTARKWFKLREPINWAITVIAFVPVFFILTQFFDWWLAAIIAGVGAFCLLFLILDKRAIGIECPHCGKYIETNTPWLCGYKQCRNENVVAFPFINECEHCHYIPKAYECHHCETPIYLSKDKQRIHVAKCLTVPKPIPVKTVVIVKDVIGDKVATQKEAERDLEHELKVTRLKSNIEIVKNQQVKPAQVTMREAMQKEIQRLYSLKMEKEDAAQHLKEAIKKQFENEPFELEKRLAMVDELMREQL